MNDPRDPGHLLDLFQHWTPKEETRCRILVDNPARLYDFPRQCRVTRVIPGRRNAASPESIHRSRGYGFRARATQLGYSRVGQY